MKPKDGEKKLKHQNTKKRRQKQKNKSQQSESEANDDSLDLREKTETKKSQFIPKINEEISEKDMKQLRTCISRQFKKSNYINFSALKNNLNMIQPEQNNKQAQQHIRQQVKTTDNMPLQTNNMTINLVEAQTYKKNLLFCHNRSQSCPFIQPLYTTEKSLARQGRSEYHGIAFSNVKADFQPQKKKISMHYLTKNRNKLKTGQSTEKKNPNHNYSNSLTQSTNTVIVHNIPNDIHQSIAPNQNLSNILYKKIEDQEQIKTNKQPNPQNNQVPKEQHKPYIKSTGFRVNYETTEKTLQKNSLAEISMKQDFFIKTKIQQRITMYQIKQEKQQLQIDSKAFGLKQKVIDKLLIPNFHAN